MDKYIWDERFSSNEYIYGETPNEFLREQLQHLTPGKALFAAEGEGRNAVFAASLGWEVVAYDASIEGKRKALKLAAAQGVELNYDISFHEQIQYPPSSFNLVVLIFAHSRGREQFHRKMVDLVKPGGKILLEGFSKEQMKFSSGGPKSDDLLFSIEELKIDFSELQSIDIKQLIINLNEGSHHCGPASVIRLIGKK